MILVVETSAEICSVALADLNGSCVSVQRAEVANTHAEKLAPLADMLLQSLNMDYSKIEAVGVSRGPGSYTGLRIGTSLAKGICYALQYPLLALSGLEGMVRQTMESGMEAEIYIANLDARRDEIYMEVYDSNLERITKTEAVIVRPEFLDAYVNKKVAVCGNANAKIAQIVSDVSGVVFSDVLPDAEFLCKEAAKKWHAQSFEDLAYFEPTYLKDFIPGISKKFSM